MGKFVIEDIITSILFLLALTIFPFTLIIMDSDKTDNKPQKEHYEWRKYLIKPKNSSVDSVKIWINKG